MNNSNRSGQHPFTSSDFYCQPPQPYDELRKWIIIVGSLLATGGMFTNVVLATLFAGGKYRNGPTMYFGFIAIFDTLTCAMYLVLFYGDYLWNDYKYIILYHVWHQIVMPCYTISHIAIFTSTLLMVCATIERYMLLKNMKACGLQNLYSMRGRRVVVSIVLLFSAVIIFPLHFEYEIVVSDECANIDQLMTYQWVPKLTGQAWYDTFSSVVIPFFKVFMPFIVLLFMNGAIVYSMKRRLIKERRRAMFLGDATFSGTSHRRNIKSSATTMLLLVTVYLICNGFNFGIKLFEQSELYERLQDNESFAWFHRYISDMTSVLVMLNCFVRIFIYQFGNPQVRQDLRQCICLRLEHYNSHISHEPSVQETRGHLRVSKGGVSFGNFSSLLLSVQRPHENNTNEGKGGEVQQNPRVPQVQHSLSSSSGISSAEHVVPNDVHEGAADMVVRAQVSSNNTTETELVYLPNEDVFL